MEEIKIETLVENNMERVSWIAEKDTQRIIAEEVKSYLVENDDIADRYFNSDFGDDNNMIDFLVEVNDVWKHSDGDVDIASNVEYAAEIYTERRSAISIKGALVDSANRLALNDEMAISIEQVVLAIADCLEDKKICKGFVFVPDRLDNLVEYVYDKISEFPDENKDFEKLIPKAVDDFIVHETETKNEIERTATKMVEKTKINENQKTKAGAEMSESYSAREVDFGLDIKRKVLNRISTLRKNYSIDDCSYESFDDGCKELNSGIKDVKLSMLEFLVDAPEGNEATAVKKLLSCFKEFTSVKQGCKYKNVIWDKEYIAAQEKLEQKVMFGIVLSDYCKHFQTLTNEFASQYAEPFAEVSVNNKKQLDMLYHEKLKPLIKSNKELNLTLNFPKGFPAEAKLEKLLIDRMCREKLDPAVEKQLAKTFLAVHSERTAKYPDIAATCAKASVVTSCLDDIKNLLDKAYVFDKEYGDAIEGVPELTAQELEHWCSKNNIESAIFNYDNICDTARKCSNKLTDVSVGELSDLKDDLVNLSIQLDSYADAWEEGRGDLSNYNRYEIASLSVSLGGELDKVIEQYCPELGLYKDTGLVAIDYETREINEDEKPSADYSYVVAVQKDEGSFIYVTGIDNEGLPLYQHGEEALVMNEKEANGLMKEMLGIGVPTVTVIVHNNLCKVPCNDVPQLEAEEVNKSDENTAIER